MNCNCDSCKALKEFQALVKTIRERDCIPTPQEETEMERLQEIITPKKVC